MCSEGAGCSGSRSGMLGHAEQADLVGQQMPAPIDGYVPDIGEHARAAPALAGDYAARGDLHLIPLSSP